MVDKLFIAMKGLVLYQGKVLLIRESSTYTDGTQTGKFDVVGGRLEKGEKFNESLLREIREETGLVVTIGKPFFVNEVRITVRGETWQIVRVFFDCHATSDVVVLGNDHNECVWINPLEYQHYPLIDNLLPVFEAYIKSLK